MFSLRHVHLYVAYFHHLHFEVRNRDFLFYLVQEDVQIISLFYCGLLFGSMQSFLNIVL